MSLPLSQNTEITLYKHAASNTTTVLQTTVFDMTGFEGIMLLAAGHTATYADTTSKLSFTVGTASDSLSQTTGMVNIGKSALYMECIRPVGRFLQGNYLVTASGVDVINTLWAIRYGAKNAPTTQPASTTGKIMYSPGTGTASG